MRMILGFPARPAGGESRPDRRHHKHLKKFLNHAIRKKAYPKARYPYGEFKVARIETEREYLTLEELHQLENFEGRGGRPNANRAKTPVKSEHSTC